MEKKFGKCLKEYLKTTGLKERELAGYINYDVTSVSKWINGAKLPSDRNCAGLIRKMAVCIAGAAGAQGQLEEREVEEILHAAWEKDRVYQELNAQNAFRPLSFIDNRKDFFDTLKRTFQQAAVIGEQKLELCVTFSVLELLGNRFYELLRELPTRGVQFIAIKMCMDMEAAVRNYQVYCETLLNTVAGYERAEITVIESREGMPWILMAGQFFCAQLLYPFGDNFAACCSTDRRVMKRYEKICREVMDTADRILTCASPENLRKTNIQLDSYSSPRQRLFFNEAPAMLLPPEVMDDMIRDTENREYQEYLRKLKNVFQRYTCRAAVDLILYSSVISDYIMNGVLSLGNVEHRMSPAQVEAHINYLARCLEENENFHLYVLKDTASVLADFQRPPSVFIDSNAVTIENSQRKPNENYHISMYPQMISAFAQYFEYMKRRPNCVELTAEELRRYL